MPMTASLCHFELITSDSAKCKEFYGRVFGFTPAGELEPVDIENL